MNKVQKYFLLLICVTFQVLVCAAQRTDTLTEIKLRSRKKTDPAATAVPVQQLNKEMLQQLGGFSVADVAKYFSGVMVKDYGGIGGLKTVSVRSLGANHTGILYNGIMVSNAQGGQIDLGKFSLDNIGEIELYNSAPVNILQTARAFSAAAVLSLKSTSPENIPTNTSVLSLQMKAGSFGFINPSLSFKTYLSKKIQTGILAEFLDAVGNFPYSSYDRSTSKRTNSDIRSERLEYHAAYIKNDSNEIRLNANYYNSRRGLPGSVIFYNPAPGTQRLNEENFFTQLSWQNYLSPKSRLLISAKFSADNTYYLDPSYPNSFGKLENYFHQKEKYLSAAYSYKFFPGLTVSLSGDMFNNQLSRTDQFANGFAAPARNTFLSNIAAQWKKERVEVSGNVLYTDLNERSNTAIAGKDFREWSPALSASFLPLKNIPVRARFFYKNIFRAPTFNDLYYTNIGNINLRPEYVQQYNTGLTYTITQSKLLKEIVVTADAYVNTVQDRILAVPRQNLFQWTILNIGKVNVKGLDMTLGFSLREIRELKISSKLAYTFQKALDISDPASVLYKTQLPYTPEHTAAINMNISFRKLIFSYNIISSSYRYRSGEQIAENVVQGWSQHDITLQYLFTAKAGPQFRFKAAFNNIYNTQYEVIKFYPMPRFCYRLGITATFKHQHKSNKK